jgi:hypothetical protein
VLFAFDELVAADKANARRTRPHPQRQSTRALQQHAVRR